ncbi:hypothetical protein C8T65DRAFT_673207 [Cerioporus squamosus]|nr:hypothetical protein C8T65DRAFT_673207 [Cerioporus squamosus]
MNHSRLPLEVCETVIDACGCEDYLRLRYDTLRACALTCKGWHPRSRYNLLARVRFRRPHQVERFLDTIVADPPLADLVHELHITPAEAHHHGFFSIANPSLVKRLHGLRKLVLGQFDWNSFPPFYYALIGKFNSVSTLEVSNIVFHSPGDLVRLVWSLPKLNELTCGLNKFTMTSSAEDCANLCALRRKSACRELHTLSLWSLNDFPPVIGAFGTMVVDLQLHQPDASWPWSAVCDSVRQYNYLRSVMLSFDVSRPPARQLADSEDANRVSAVQQQDPLMLIQEQFTSLLRSIHSDYMHTIFLRLAPTMDAGKDGICSFTYHSDRAHAIDLLLGPEVRDILTSGPLARLALLRVHVQENSLAHGPEWWCATLRERLGPVPKEIRVHVDYYAPEVLRGKCSYVQLWS